MMTSIAHARDLHPAKAMQMPRVSYIIVIVFAAVAVFLALFFGAAFFTGRTIAVMVGLLAAMVFIFGVVMFMARRDARARVMQMVGERLPSSPPHDDVEPESPAYIALGDKMEELVHKHVGFGLWASDSALELAARAVVQELHDSGAMARLTN